MRTPEEIEDLRARMNRLNWWHSIDLGDGLVTRGREPMSHSRDQYLDIPVDLTGKRVLDIGTYDGMYAFEAEKRGASYVLGFDHRTQPGFELARAALNSRAEFRLGNVDYLYDSTRPLPQFDVVFCFGVLYHLRFGPMRSLWQIEHVMAPGGLLIVETALASVSDKVGPPLLEFTPHGRDGDPTNYWYPNRSCMEQLLLSSGFFDLDFKGGVGNRGTWHCRKP